MGERIYTVILVLHKKVVFASYYLFYNETGLANQMGLQPYVKKCHNLNLFTL